MADGPDPTERKGAEGIDPELGAPGERQGRRAGAEPGLSEEERDAAREIVRKLREKVLCGDFVCAKSILEKWMKPHDVLVMFVSSTFTDTMIERNILLQNVLPELRKKGREQGVEARFVDMRYGIQDDSTVHQLTWRLCVEQLEKCFRAKC